MRLTSDRKRGTKKRCAGTAVVLALLVAFGIGQAWVYFTGVLNPNNKGTVIDSVTVVPPDTTFQTAGWQGQGVKHDTFVFPDLPQWPTDLWVYGTINGLPAATHIVDPEGHKWYPFGVGTIVPFVMFHDYVAVEEPRSAVEPRPRLAVSPSVVTEQMTVRLQPVGTSRPVVQIHDAVGNAVRSLGCTTGADGTATATWNREDDRGRLVPEGVYFCRYAGAGVTAVRKILVAH
jgi:hypothetical protein